MISVGAGSEEDEKDLDDDDDDAMPEVEREPIVDRVAETTAAAAATVAAMGDEID